MGERPIRHHVANLARIHRIHEEAGGNDAEALARLFEDERITDDGGVRGRVAALLDATAHRWVPGIHTLLDVPGLYEIKGQSDVGFRPELKDPWAVSRDQTGHLLTALALRMQPGQMRARRFGLRVRDLVGAPTGMEDAEVAVRLAIGHEKAPDPGRYDPLILWKLRRQFRSATGEDVAAFDAALRRLGDGHLLDLDGAGQALAAIAVGDGIGNSVPDLLLSLIGFKMADLIGADAFAERGDVARWLRANVCDPAA